jgi:DoxX-like protein
LHECRSNSAILSQEEHVTSSASEPGWAAIAILVGRLIFVAYFIMEFGLKFMDINGTAGYIASAGFPISNVLAWLAAIFEVLLALGFLTGAYSEDLPTRRTLCDVPRPCVPWAIALAG